MKQTRLWILLMLTIVVTAAAAVTPPTDLSLRGIVEWVGVGGHISSGTGVLPPAGTKGTRYDDLSNTSRVTEYRSNGSAWKPLSTWNHAQLDNLLYAFSGHGIVPLSFGGTGAANASDARANLDVYSVEETDQLIAQTVALLRYYVSSETTDLPGFGTLSEVASLTESSFTTASLTTTMTQITQRITAAGRPNISQTVAGVYPFSVNLQRSGGKLAYFQVALFKRDTVGSETHIASSSVYTLTDDLRKTVVLELMAPETVTWAPTDRLVLRSYAAKESTGVAVNITFYYGDGNQSYITLSAGGGGVYARQDLHNVEPLTGRLALGFPPSAGKANYVLAVGTDTTTLYWSPVGGGGGGATDHSLLTNLDYALSGHTGFEEGGTTATHAADTSTHGVAEVAGIEDIPNNASFSFDLLSDSPDYTGNGGKVLALNAEGTALQWTAVAGVGSMSHATLSDLDYAGSGHTGFAASSDLAAYQPIASMGAYALDTDIPNNASFTLAGLGEKSYWNLTDLPTFGTMASETATDYLKAADLPPGPNNASFTFMGLGDAPASRVPANMALSLASDGTTLYWQQVRGFSDIATRSTLFPASMWASIGSWSVPGEAIASTTTGNLCHTAYTGSPHGTYPFDGNVVLPDGRVFLLQENSDYNAVFDPINNSLQTFAALTTTNNLWAGALIATNGVIICIPEISDYVGVVYYPSMYYVSNKTAHGKADSAFFGGVMLPNGSALFSPYNSTTIGLYNPFTFTYSDGPAHGEGSLAFAGAALTATGTVVLIPHNSDYIGLYDCNTNTYSRGPAHGEGDAAFLTGLTLPDGRILMVPWNSDYIGLYSPNLASYTRGPSLTTTNRAFRNATLLPGGDEVFLAPYNHTNPAIYTISANSVRNVGFNLGAGPNAMGAIMVPDGRVVMPPANRGDIMTFYSGQGPLDLETCLSPWMNKP